MDSVVDVPGVACAHVHACTVLVVSGITATVEVGSTALKFMYRVEINGLSLFFRWQRDPFLLTLIITSV